MSLIVLATLAVAGCEGIDVQPVDRPERGGPGEAYEHRAGSQGSIFGPSGLQIFGGRKEEAAAATGGIGVNSFLWRASLDTLSFMPLSSADPFGGVIITDWYTPPETPAERFKMTVYILDRRLRADGLKVAVFRQQRQTGRDWVDAEVASETATELENAILTRARQLRIDTLAN